jgi:hypothetical protein
MAKVVDSLMAKRRVVAEAREASAEDVEAREKLEQHIISLARQHGNFEPVARMAGIPPDNKDAFIADVALATVDFRSAQHFDRLVKQRRLAINEFVKALAKFLCAIERMRKYEKTELTDIINDLAFHTCFGLGERFHAEAGLTSLADIQHELTGIQRSAIVVTASELPKVREGATQIFLKNIWAAAHKHGGKLTYNKHSHRGSLTEVIRFCGTMEGWQDLSPSTLDRLRPRTPTLPRGLKNKSGA